MIKTRAFSFAALCALVPWCEALSQGFYTGTGSGRIGLDDVDTNHELSFDAETQFEAIAIFKRTGNHDLAGRIVQHANGVYAANGYMIAYNFSPASNHRPALRLSSSGAMVPGSDAYSTGDIVCLIGKWDLAGNEGLLLAANRGAVSSLKQQNMADMNATGTGDFRLGGSNKDSARDPHIELYRVLMYARHLSLTELNHLAATDGRMFPIDGLVAAWAAAPADVTSGQNITTGSELKDIAGDSNLPDIDNTPQAVAAEVGQAPFQGTLGGTF